MAKTTDSADKTRKARTSQRFKEALPNINRILFLFLAYSFFGWLVETCSILIFTQTFVFRGYSRLGLPIIPLYGGVGLLLPKLLSPWKKKPLVVFGGATIIATVIEYLIGLITIYIFRSRHWDYSNTPLSFQGIISLPTSLAWGVMALVVMYWGKPKLEQVFKRIPLVPATIICWGLTLYACICAAIDMYQMCSVFF
ncbi:MAG: putative ABC transporter permease [Actinobacteria bacterium]|nr:putative ABC transporter permease [Actinomycetota bacterium]